VEAAFECRVGAGLLGELVVLALHGLAEVGRVGAAVHLGVVVPHHPVGLEDVGIDQRSAQQGGVFVDQFVGLVGVPEQIAVLTHGFVPVVAVVRFGGRALVEQALVTAFFPAATGIVHVVRPGQVEVP